MATHRGLEELEQLTRDATTVNGVSAEAERPTYRCQATEALRASEPLSNYDPRQYIRELSSGNVGLTRFARVMGRAMSAPVRRRLRLLGSRPLPYHGVPPKTRGDLNLQPGEMAEVRSPEEIAPTIDESGRTRGLSFDWEMTPYCRGRHRVGERVERIIDEQNGQMIEISSDCLILEDVVCSGEHSRGRWFCPRAIYPYWREAWLRRVDDGDPSVPGPAEPT